MRVSPSSNAGCIAAGHGISSFAVPLVPRLMRVLTLVPDATVVAASQCCLLYVLRGDANVRFLDLDMALARGELLRLDDADDLPFQLRATKPDTALVEIGIEREVRE